MKNVIENSSLYSIKPGEQTAFLLIKYLMQKCREYSVFCIIVVSLMSLFTFGSTARASEVNSREVDPDEVDISPDPPTCLKYDRYNYTGSESPFPSNCESITPELGGLRESMYDAGWNAQFILTSGVTYDLKNHDRETQVYSGQRPSYSSTGSLLVNHDLERYGFPEGSLFTLGGSFAYNSFSGDGLREAFISQLSARVPFHNDQVVFQLGYYSLAGQFYGTLLGNNIAASTLGPSSGILAQTGAQGFKPSPALDIRLYSRDKNYYNHFGVARSISPHGLFPDSDDNRSGLQFHTEDAGPVFMNEVGYRVESGPGQRKIWLRGGVIYNTSDYTRLDDPEQKSNNYGSYIVGDFQLTQPSSALPYKGWYVNAYFNQGRENVNYLPDAFGGSIYSQGPFDSRPYDLFAFGVSKNLYSSWARKNASAAGQNSARASTSFSLSYTYRVHRGIYLQSALIHTDNPTFSPRRDGALNANVNLVLAF